MIAYFWASLNFGGLPMRYYDAEDSFQGAVPYINLCTGTRHTIFFLLFQIIAYIQGEEQELSPSTTYRVSNYRLASKDALVCNGYTCHIKI